MPAEHQPQSEVWMAWPIRPDNWRLGAAPTQRVFAAVASAISEVTPVVMIVQPSHYEAAREQLPERIKVLSIPYDDSWMRDIGATYLLSPEGQRRGISWQFNAWGGEVDGLYPQWERDSRVAEQMLSLTGDDFYIAPFVLEGGSIHCDGEGTLYTTEECLLHPGRNSELGKSDIEALLRIYLNIEKVIWLPAGLYEDETNGHIDNILHVAGPGEVLLTWCDDPADPQYQISRLAYDVLTTETDAKGRPIVVHKLPMPGPLYITEEEARGIKHSSMMDRQPGTRLAASYANFLITNGRVIFPLLDERHDQQARAVLQRVFSGYEIIGIEAREVLLGGGNIHCITQQVPRGSAAP
ncbi:agmatine deiminase [Reinekea marinisedimentorum]|uniref:Putative agmatine deiminase n=2 Tax=Reinekea marinisedimentorum TaxID=230495 RepID=A0A4R3I727_9GAMM|nr:agmatine deiminase [Reinekea marinisedimentorum]